MSQKFLNLFASFDTSIPLFYSILLVIFPTLALINTILNRHWKNAIVVLGSLAGFVAFLLLANLAISPYPGLSVKVIFMCLFGLGNTFLWPNILRNLTTAQGIANRIFWFFLSLFPVACLWLLVYIFNS